MQKLARVFGSAENEQPLWFTPTLRRLRHLKGLRIRKRTFFLLEQWLSAVRTPTESGNAAALLVID